MAFEIAALALLALLAGPTVLAVPTAPDAIVSEEDGWMLVGNSWGLLCAHKQKPLVIVNVRSAQQQEEQLK